MAKQGDIMRIDLGIIEPPWRQTDIAWLAIKEGLQEIYSSDYNGRGDNAIVVIPHRIQATFVCMCGTSIVVKYFSRDALRGHIANTRKCSCGKDMKRKFIGAERDVPLEERVKPKSRVIQLVGYVQRKLDEMFDDEKTSDIDNEDIMD